MRTNDLGRGFAIAVTFALAIAGCGDSSKKSATGTIPLVDAGTYPYHPVVYHLDLAILAYQNHGQSLVWPYDPFYEERAQLLGSARNGFMGNVRGWATIRGATQVAQVASLNAVRGPGRLAGFDDNPTHDPVVYDYSRLHPWSSCIFNAAGEWTEYLTPKEITGKIRDVFVAYRPIGKAEDAVAIDPVPVGRLDSDADASNVMIAFEGGTGGTGLPGQPPSQSLMGFVLARSRGGSDYDVHVVFRGSRSGQTTRAFFDALSARDPKGNPDWITDLGYDLIDRNAGGAHVTTIGSVARGFATALKSMLPKVMAALDRIATIKGRAPTNVTVTGHSLGGALAQHFTSAVLLGDPYGPPAGRAGMPASVRSWPWDRVKLMTFGAPRCGDETWAKVLTETCLQSEFFSSTVSSFDPSAFRPTALGLVPRVLDEARPTGFRVLVSTDPITSPLLVGGAPVGKTVHTDDSSALGIFDPDSHEPITIRKQFLTALADPRPPLIAWRYLAMKDLNPARDESAKGTRPEFQKLADSVGRYYSDRGLYFDQQKLKADLQLLFDIEANVAK